ncbi:phospholipase A2 inhibitor gamma subunit B-like [Silurus meridionalis]|uniref:UPAR/Ly6 domain-containing protein n=1 Tax=Silurus meridionalis TaxID=175797 RepID=A0A8T0BWX1_SILME|nr:phospholipase A2 inhibitor gamma subunit B-like [Silurus meridionalis]KAF7711821.1 hypothetical protein HF521_000832 [Silurus meridionalis]
MKLLLALFLLSSYLSSVFMLHCLDCTSESGQCNTELKQECTDNQVCATLKYRFFISGVNISSTEVKRSCHLRNECERWNTSNAGIIYSGNIGIASGTLFVSCCDSDNCNNIVIPELDSKPNGLQCMGCNNLADTVCNTTVSCVGNEDQCIKIQNESPVFWTPAEKSHTMGCISKSICDMNTNKLKLNQTLCCSENFCNKL